MKNKFVPGIAFILLLAGILIINSCKKEPITINEPPVSEPQPLSFTEDFNNVSGLTAKGWVFKNNSHPVGSNGWRQGRYETSVKFPVEYIGFPAYNASTTPNDFISCDAACVNLVGDISAWLISPPMKIKNGDVISFFTRAADDSKYNLYTKDRMQVLANFSGDGSSDVGNTPVSVGSFTTKLLDINELYTENDFGGYPYLEWEQFTIIITGLDEQVDNARFAFRYFGTDAGINADTNAPSVVGIDHLVFTSN